MSRIPSLEDIIKGAAGENADLFASLDPRVRENVRMAQARGEEDARAVASAWAQFAETPGGRKALDLLFDTTLRRTVYFAQLGLDIQQMAVFGAFREGQNALAQEIARQIARGRGDEQPKPRDLT